MADPQKNPSRANSWWMAMKPPQTVVPKRAKTVAGALAAAKTAAKAKAKATAKAKQAAKRRATSSDAWHRSMNITDVMAKAAGRSASSAKKKGN